LGAGIVAGVPSVEFHNNYDCDADQPMGRLRKLDAERTL
jgi:hypothetical protein